jgi:hypothetical protein
MIEALDPAIGSFDFMSNKISETVLAPVLVEFYTDHPLIPIWVKAYSLATN